MKLLYLTIYRSSSRIDVDNAYPASSSSTRRWRPAWSGPCSGLGSAGLALGGATFRGATISEEPGPGSRRRPSSPLVAFAWATFGAEGAGPAGGGTSPCQGGGRARPSLHGCVRGRQVLQYLAVSSGISLQLWSCEGSFSLGVHRPRRRNRECPRFFCSIQSLISYLASDVLFNIIWNSRRCIRDYIYYSRRCIRDYIYYSIRCNLNTKLFYISFGLVK